MGQRISHLITQRVQIPSGPEAERSAERHSPQLQAEPSVNPVPGAVDELVARAHELNQLPLLGSRNPFPRKAATSSLWEAPLRWLASPAAPNQGREAIEADREVWPQPTEIREQPASLQQQANGRAALDHVVLMQAGLPEHISGWARRIVSTQFDDEALAALFADPCSSNGREAACGFLLCEIARARRVAEETQVEGPQSRRFIEWGKALQRAAGGPVRCAPPHHYKAEALARADVALLKALCPPGTLMRSLVHFSRGKESVNTRTALHWLPPATPQTSYARGLAITHLQEDLAVNLRGVPLARRMNCVVPIVLTLYRQKDPASLEGFLDALTRGEPSTNDPVASAMLMDAIALRWVNGCTAILRNRSHLANARVPQNVAISKDVPLGGSVAPPDTTMLQYLADPQGKEDDRTLEMARLLLRHGANPHTLGMLGQNDRTATGLLALLSPHVHACLFGFPRLAALLAEEEKKREPIRLDLNLADTAMGLAQLGLIALEGGNLAGAAVGFENASSILYAQHIESGLLNRSAHGHLAAMFSSALWGPLLEQMMEQREGFQRHRKPPDNKTLTRQLYASHHPEYLRAMIEEFLELMAQWKTVTLSGETTGAAHAPRRSKKKAATVRSEAANAEAAWEEVVVAGKARDHATPTHFLFNLAPLALFAWRNAPAGLRLYLRTESNPALPDLAIAWMLALKANSAHGEADKGAEDAGRQQVQTMLLDAAQTEQQFYILMETAIVAQSSSGVKKVVDAMVARGKKRKLTAPPSLLRSLFAGVLPMGPDVLNQVLQILPKGPVLREALALRDESGDTVLHIAQHYGRDSVDLLSALLRPEDRAFQIRNIEGKLAIENGCAEDETDAVRLPSKTEAVFSDEEAQSQYFLNISRRHARPEGTTTPPQSNSPKQKLTVLQQLERASSGAARDQIIDEFLMEAAKSEKGETSQASIQQAWKIMASLHRTSPMQGMGVHFLAHHPQLPRSALVARLNDADLARDAASAFGPRDAIEILRLRQRAMAMANDEIEPDNYRRHTLDLPSQTLSGACVRFADDGLSIVDDDEMQAIRFVMARQRGRDGVLLISCYPIADTHRGRWPLGLLRAAR